MLDNRFWNKVDKMGCCWYWVAVLSGNGYGQFWLNGKMKLAHILSYEDKFGKTPDGLELNHICRNRKCCNPDHLEAITHSENIQKGISVNRNKTHCPQGHEYNEENTYIRSNRNHRECRICKRIQCSQYYQRKQLEQVK